MNDYIIRATAANDQIRAFAAVTTDVYKRQVFVMMLSINVWMTLAALLILPLSMLIINFVMKHSQKYFQAQQKYLGCLLYTSRCV